MFRMWAAGAAMGLALMTTSTAARDVYVKPGAVQAAADGTEARPFPGVEAALAVGVAPGDRLLLAPGDHGPVRIRGIRASPPVHVEPAPGSQTPPGLTSLRIEDASGVTIAGLRIEGGDGDVNAPLVEVAADASDIVLQGLTVRSGERHADWSAETWLARARRGIVVHGARVSVLDSDITAVRHGVEILGPDARVIGNVVDGFSGDGMRGLGDGGLFEGNRIQNCVKVDGNHDDGFQSWSRGPDGKSGGGMVQGVILRANAIINHVGARGPLTCDLQGIGLFNGMYADWLIERNVVEVDSWHGITVLGATNTRVLENVVRNISPGPPGPPWITVSAHKDGRSGTGNLIAGNRTTGLLMDSSQKMGIDPRATAVRDNLRLAPAR